MLEKINKYKLINLSRRVQELQDVDENGRFYIDLTSKDPEKLKLKAVLREWGCFDYFCLNSGEFRIGVSQVIFFLKRGWKDLEKGILCSSKEFQINHVNGNKQDNSWGNLEKVTISEHQQLSSLQRGIFGNEDVFVPLADKETRSAFNSRGEEIKNYQKWWEQKVAACLIRSAQWMERLKSGAKKVVVQVKSILEAAFNVASKNLGWVLDKVGTDDEKNYYNMCVYSEVESSNEEVIPY